MKLGKSYRTRKLKILNVGQGDSVVLLPDECCQFDSYSIYIDVGDGKHDILKIGKTENAIIQLSHSHDDHIGGLKYFIKNNFDSVKQIWIPFYYDEVCKITKYITKLKGSKFVPIDNSSYISCKNVLNTAFLIYTLSNNLNLEIRGLYDGKLICNHIDICNPPIEIEKIFNLEENQLNKFIEYNEDNNYEIIKKWFDEDVFYELQRDLGIRIYDNNKSIDDEFNIIEDEILTEENRKRFIWAFFCKFQYEIEQFIENPHSRNFDIVFNCIKLTSNDTSIILKYEDMNLDVLFTGDASKKVFNRLINEKRYEIKSNILKIPHHGSKKNINKSILKYINPKYAIVSHDNGRFGRQRDPHPNKEVIKIIDELAIDTLYTNDVMKDGIKIKSKPNKENVNRYMEYYEL